MLGLARTLLTIGIGVLAWAGADHHQVCPPEPSVCGYVEGATRYYQDHRTEYQPSAIHQEMAAATQYVAGATGIAFD